MTDKDAKILKLIDLLKENFTIRGDITGKKALVIILEAEDRSLRPKLFNDVKEFLEKNNYRFEKIPIGSFFGFLIKGGNEISKLTIKIKFKNSKTAAGTTSLQESAHCLGLALREFKRKDISPEDFTLENAKKVKSKIQTTETIEKLIKFLNSNPAWNKSICTIVNSLYPVIGGGYTYHRGSNLVMQIEKKFNELKRKLKGINPQINKWNPSDIWVSKINQFNPPKEIDNLLELNKYLEKLFYEKKLIGISLKMTNKQKARIDIIKYKDLDIKFDKFIKDKVSPFNTKSTYIAFKGTKTGQILLKNSTKNGSISGEILGSAARHGRIGLTIMEFVISKRTGRKFITYKLKDIRNMKFEDKYSLMWKLYKSVFQDYQESKFNESYLKKKDKITDDFFISKIQGLQIMDVIKSAKKDEKDKIIKDFIMYAASIGLKGYFESSIYYKAF